MKRDDAEYYRARAIQEQVAAQMAACPEARNRHDELANMYRFRAAILTKPPGNWGGDRTVKTEPEHLAPLAGEPRVSDPPKVTAGLGPSIQLLLP